MTESLPREPEPEARRIYEGFGEHFIQRSRELGGIDPSKPVPEEGATTNISAIAAMLGISEGTAEDLMYALVQNTVHRAKIRGYPTEINRLEAAGAEGIMFGWFLHEYINETHAPTRWNRFNPDELATLTTSLGGLGLDDPIVAQLTRELIALQSGGDDSIPVWHPGMTGFGPHHCPLCGSIGTGRWMPQHLLDAHTPD